MNDFLKRNGFYYTFKESYIWCKWLSVWVCLSAVPGWTQGFDHSWQVFYLWAAAPKPYTNLKEKIKPNKTKQLPPPTSLDNNMVEATTEIESCLF